MSVRIKVSYTTDKEMTEVLRLLSPAVRSVSVSRNQKGKYSKAYVELDNLPGCEDTIGSRNICDYKTT